MTEWPARLVLVGAGKMGGAMAQGWLEAGLPASSLTIIEPNPSSEIASLAAVEAWRLTLTLNPRPPRCWCWRSSRRASIRSRRRSSRLPASKRSFSPSLRVRPSPIFSLAFHTRAPSFARCPTRRLQSAGGSPRPSPTPPSTRGQRRWCERLLGAVGTFFWLDDEGAIDAVTAISGSGPAYVFALTEALAVAAERLGLPAELSMSLARGTVEGAAELMRRESATSPATLRRNVTSPGGTTAAALAVLQDTRRARGSHGPGCRCGPRPRRGDGGLASFLGGGRLSAYISGNTTRRNAMATRPKNEAEIAADRRPRQNRGRSYGARGRAALRGHLGA